MVRKAAGSDGVYRPRTATKEALPWLLVDAEAKASPTSLGLQSSRPCRYLNDVTKSVRVLLLVKERA